MVAGPLDIGAVVLVVEIVWVGPTLDEVKAVGPLVVVVAELERVTLISPELEAWTESPPYTAVTVVVELENDAPAV